jgi:hypothetical protein
MTGRWLIAIVLCASAPAAAGTVGVITNEPQIASAASEWLSANDRTVIATPLDGQQSATLRDCFVIEDLGCARTIVDRHATADVIVYIAIARDKPELGVAMHWLVKHGPASSRSEACAGCTDAMVRDRVITSLAQLANTNAPPAAAAVTTGATTPASAPASSTTATGAVPRARGGLALGVELGEPTSATLAWFAGKLSIGGAIGSGTLAGAGLSLRAGLQLEVTRLASQIPLRVGLGGRIYHHGYEVMSIDELPDTHYGVFASIAAAVERGPLQLYAEVAPGLDIARTRGCALGSGAATVCPHVQQAPVFVHFLVGARWFLAH